MAGSAASTRPLRLAHRGDWRAAPENTLAAFTAALAIPACDGLELDVRRSADGALVVYHDETLQRVHGRPDRVDALTVDALDALGIPTLADILLAVGRRVFLDIELKVDPRPDVAGVLAAGRGPGLTAAIVSSFDPVALERVAQPRAGLAALAQQPGAGPAVGGPGGRARLPGGRRRLAIHRRAVRGHGAIGRSRRGGVDRPAAGRPSTAWHGSGSSRSASRPPRSTADRADGVAGRDGAPAGVAARLSCEGQDGGRAWRSGRNARTW